MFSPALPKGVSSRDYCVASLRLFIVSLVVLLSATAAWAQDVDRSIYSFTGGSDGSVPTANVIFDSSGNLYGTTSQGGDDFSGVVFKLTPNGSGGWTESVLYTFTGGNDGELPAAGLIFDSEGNLYGTTVLGGTSGDGVVFKLTPATNPPWTETVLWNFADGDDGGFPSGSLVFDTAGNLYGTAQSGGTGLEGVVFELSPTTTPPWTETVLWNFAGGDDGITPLSSVVFDSNGNLYGTTEAGGSGGNGIVFRLSPPPAPHFPANPWTESVLWNFTGGADGGAPSGNVTFDNSGNLYSTTSGGGADASGAVFKLTPTTTPPWGQTLLWTFTGGFDGGNPLAGVIFDSNGNLYGTANTGGLTTAGCNAAPCGLVFELSPTTSGPWKETVLYPFTGSTDGASPQASLLFDSDGNLYGTAAGSVQGEVKSGFRSKLRPAGGVTPQDGVDGVVFELSPISISCTPTPSYAQQNVTCTSNVGGPGILPIPTGTVTFYDYDAELASVSLTGTNAASFSSTTLSFGLYGMWASYQGDTNYQPGHSPFYLQQVNRVPVTGTIKSSQNPAQVGQSVMFTATFTPTITGLPSVPTGTVTFKDFGTALSTQSLPSNGVVTFTTSSLSGNNTHEIVADYNADKNYAPSATPYVNQVEDRLPISITLSSGMSPVTYPQSVTFSGTLTPPLSGVTIAFKAGSTAEGSAMTNGSGQFSTTFVPSGGTYEVTASFAGNATYAPATANTMQVVNRAATSTALTASPTMESSPAPVTLTATVSSTAGTPTGNVTFYDGTSAIATTALNGMASSDSAQYVVETPTVRAHSYKAVYDDNSDFAASTSNVATVTVN